jgi:ApaG protein
MRSNSHFMSDPENPELLEGLEVRIDRVVYMPDAQTPDNRPHAFAYFITIDNHSSERVTIKGRKWVIRNEEGGLEAVEGDGVVGEFPELEPGEHFSYNSFHITASLHSSAEGSYLAQTSAGRKVIARIPRFDMIVPDPTPAGEDE